MFTFMLIITGIWFLLGIAVHWKPILMGLWCGVGMLLAMRWFLGNPGMALCVGGLAYSRVAFALTGVEYEWHMPKEKKNQKRWYD